MPQPPPRSRLAAALILATGIAAAAAILISAARDSALPSPQPTTTNAPTNPAEYGVVARTPDDPANPQPWTPDGR